ncbi:methyltransferase domain-containing protein [Swingsia samuiensis]|uniref:Methyltransferase domain-containing protein n=1 Tax=Swingsia samuiensis TaxID=1293412 RepID=A0A4Y6UJ38_9PROT|nr:methyltransferase domain-containing protein [Swingsia samuiensis]QDH16401.1 methyltransferase domain-containing protein [Swingsia samuiensis]
MRKHLIYNQFKDAASFYDSPLGHRTANLIFSNLTTLHPKIVSEHILGIGYPAPYLASNPNSICARINHGQTYRSTLRASKECLISSECLPFDDLSIDTTLVIHGLEFSHSPANFLRSIWKIMKDDGVLILVVPNRRSAWAHNDSTPFGHGTPFSRQQLNNLLKQCFFRTEIYHKALILPPSILSKVSGTFAEKLNQFAVYPCAGVHIVLAHKNIHAGIPALKEEKNFSISRQLIKFA